MCSATRRSTDAAAQHRAWEATKAEERARRAALLGSEPSVLDDVPVGLPALTRAGKLQKRAARIGFDWAAAAPVLAKIREELGELEAEIEGGSTDRKAEELGDLLFAVTNLGRHLGLDAEVALRQANAKFERRFRAVEAAARGMDGGPEGVGLDGARSALGRGQGTRALGLQIARLPKGGQPAAGELHGAPIVDVERDKRQRGGGKLLSEPTARGDRVVLGEQPESELLEAGIVPHDHQPPDAGRLPLNGLEQTARSGEVEGLQETHRRLGNPGLGCDLDRADRPTRGRAEDEVRDDPVLDKKLTHLPCGPLATRCQVPLVVSGLRQVTTGPWRDERAAARA